jgi:hypothetical protein
MDQESQNGRVKTSSRLAKVISTVRSGVLAFYQEHAN